MDVAVTGATGYVGSAVAGALLGAGHRVIGVSRSGGSAEKLKERGMEARRGDLGDAGSIARAVRGADAVVHAATTHGPEAEAADRTAVAATLEELRGTGRTFVYTSGGWVMGDTAGETADEESPIDPTPMLAWRPAVEREVLAAAESHGVRTVVIRPALVYGGGGGVVGELVGSAQERGAARHVVPPGGENSWTLVHRDDLGDLYARVLERGSMPEGLLLIAAGGEPVRAREVAEAASRAAGTGGRVEAWPLEEAREELGPYADALALDQRLSGARARRMLGWAPSAPSVFEELGRGSYRTDGS